MLFYSTLQQFTQPQIKTVNYIVFNTLSILISKILVFNQIIWSIHLPSHYRYYYYNYYYLIKGKIKILKDEVNYSEIYHLF